MIRRILEKGRNIEYELSLTEGTKNVKRKINYQYELRYQHYQHQVQGFPQEHPPTSHQPRQQGPQGSTHNLPRTKFKKYSEYNISSSSYIFLGNPCKNGLLLVYRNLNHIRYSHSWARFYLKVIFLKELVAYLRDLICRVACPIDNGTLEKLCLIKNEGEFCIFLFKTGSF